MYIIILIFVIYKILDYLIRIPRLGKYKDRYILITGCDTGFGHEAAKRFDALGCHVFAGCLTEAGETELRKVCSQNLLTISLDISKHESVLHAYEVVCRHIPKGKGLWGIVNNAGITGAYGGLADWLIVQDYLNVMSVNLLGAIDVTMTFLPLVKTERGRIVNTSSIVGRHAAAMNAPYSISKYGVEAFSDIIRRELRPFGISVHIVEPGSFKTNLTNADRFNATLLASWNRLTEEKRKEYGKEFLDYGYKILNGSLFKMIANDRLSYIVNAYEQALFGRFPRARYMVGFDAKFIFLPLQLLPEWLGDWLLINSLQMPTPAGCKK